MGESGFVNHRTFKGIPLGVPFKGQLDPLLPDMAAEYEQLVIIPCALLKVALNTSVEGEVTLCYEGLDCRIDLSRIKEEPMSDDCLVDLNQNMNQGRINGQAGDPVPVRVDRATITYSEIVEDQNTSHTLCKAQDQANMALDAAIGKEHSEGSRVTSFISTGVTIESDVEQKPCLEELATSMSLSAEDVSRKECLNAVGHKICEQIITAQNQLDQERVTSKVRNEESENDASQRKSRCLSAKGHRVDYSTLIDLNGDESLSDAETQRGNEEDHTDANLVRPGVETKHEKVSEELPVKRKRGRPRKVQVDPDFKPERIKGKPSKRRRLSAKGHRVGDSTLDLYGDKSSSQTETQRGYKDLKTDTNSVTTEMLPGAETKAEKITEGLPVKKKKGRPRKEKVEPALKPERIKVNLSEHMDKFTVEMMESIAMKDRGKSHEEKAEEVMSCNICHNYKTGNKDKIEAHLEKHLNGNLTCKECGYIAAFNLELNRHRAKEHFTNVFVCHICGMEVRGKYSYEGHLASVHGKPIFPCKFCPATEKPVPFPSYQARVRHYKSDHKDKLYSCDKCGIVFLKKNACLKHTQACTGADQPKECKCDKCGKIYHSITSLNHHIQNVHDLIRLFTCSKCAFSATNKQAYRLHMAKHDGFHPFRCDQCPFTCVQKFQLTSHMRTHSGEKPFKCDQCNYAASWNVQLKDHKKVHGMTGTVRCEPCGIVLKDDRSLKLHNSKEHSKLRQISHE